jgi:acyl carrier protein
LHSDMTETERIVRAMWEKELNATEVESESDFFQLGGDSLVMLNMLFVVNQQLGVDIQPAALFEDSTLRGFCRRLDREVAGMQAAGPTVMVEGSI